MRSPSSTSLPFKETLSNPHAPLGARKPGHASPFSGDFLEKTITWGWGPFKACKTDIFGIRPWKNGRDPSTLIATGQLPCRVLPGCPSISPPVILLASVPQRVEGTETSLPENVSCTLYRMSGQATSLKSGSLDTGPKECESINAQTKNQSREPLSNACPGEGSRHTGTLRQRARRTHQE